MVKGISVAIVISSSAPAPQINLLVFVLYIEYILSTMIEKTIEHLHHLIKIIPALLINIDEKEFSYKSSDDKWSKKEILGHLIDSATNNHQRFVRSQFEDTPSINYDQNKWNKYNFYNQIEKEQLIAFWTIYNKQLYAIIRLIPKDHLIKMCNTGGVENVTIEFLFNDYVLHMEYHLKQIVSYS
ncbi:MAG: DinB family protein [Cytophagales bacterium]|nr:DinB family protein [Cytophaga sp.]